MDKNLLDALTAKLIGPKAHFWPRRRVLDRLPREPERSDNDYSSPVGLFEEIPGGNPEAPSPISAIFGLAASGGGIPGSISRSTSPQIERRASSMRRIPSEERLLMKPAGSTPRTYERATSGFAKTAQDAMLAKKLAEITPEGFYRVLSK